LTYQRRSGSEEKVTVQSWRLKMSGDSMLLLLFFTTTWMSTSQALSIAPVTYTQEYPNGKFLFVMLSPLPVDQEIQFYTNDPGRKEQVLEIRRTYPRSGLYRNDGSKDLLWPVGWWRPAVLIANDGVHAASVGPYGNPAVTFYRYRP